MRTWEIEDSRAVPTNLVLEQDLILRIRRLHRTGTPYLVSNVLLTAIPEDYSGRGTLEEAHKRIHALVQAQKGLYAEVSNGDVFLLWPESALSKSFPEQLLMVTLPNGYTPEDKAKYILTYALPDDYPLLRERANFYVETSRQTAKTEDEDTPVRLLQSDAARGPLTAWSVNLIERLFKEIDLCDFIRSQSIYEWKKDKSWQFLADEAFIGLEDLRRTFFQHTEITEPKHLFLDLCQALDRGLLSTLSANYDSISDMVLHLNLSIPTVLGVEFAQFTHHLHRPQRQKICFEIHVGDLMQDFALALNALATLRQEGYRIALDGITPDMAGFINFPHFDVDFIKINVSKDRAMMLKYQTIRQSIMAMPKDKVIFFHCDSETALNAGIDMGITKYQGWLIDDQARKWRKP